MREEQIPAACRAVAGFMNGGRFEAGRSELAPSHSGQVEVQRRPGAGVTGRSLSVEEHGMPFQRFSQVALGGLAQEGVAIHKLARKRLRHLVTNLVAAAPDRGSESRYLVLRIRVEDASQLAHNLFDDPRQSSAPAGMNRRYYPEPRVGNEHGKAIRHPDGQQDAAVRRSATRRQVGFRAAEPQNASRLARAAAECTRRADSPAAAGGPDRRVQYQIASLRLDRRGPSGSASGSQSRETVLSC